MSALGWTNTEKLIVVLEEGSIAKYDIHGNYLHQSALPNVSMVFRVCARALMCMCVYVFACVLMHQACMRC